MLLLEIVIWWALFHRINITSVGFFIITEAALKFFANTPEQTDMIQELDLFSKNSKRKRNQT